MKKFISLMFIVLAFSCSDSEDPAPNNPNTPDNPQAIAPSISAPAGYEEVFRGITGSPINGALVRKITVSTPEGFKELRIQKIVNGNVAEYEGVNADGADSDTGHEYTLNYILNANDVGKDISFRAIVRDQKDAETSLVFASIETHLPMIKSGAVSLYTNMPPDGNVNTNYFLYIQNDKVKSLDIAEMVTNDLDSDVAAVFSANDGYGLYLTSPDAIIETNVVVKIQDRRKTKFKEVDVTTAQFDALNQYDLFKVQDIFEEGVFGSHEQRAGLLEKGKVISFLTDDNRVGLIKVIDMKVVNNEFKLDLDIYVSQ